MPFTARLGAAVLPSPRPPDARLLACLALLDAVLLADLILALDARRAAAIRATWPRFGPPGHGLKVTSKIGLKVAPLFLARLGF